jgi:uncharacterized protein YndB with AHSA1/START domain
MILQPTQNVQNIPIVQEVILKATVSEVWNALTDKGEMRKWYFDLDEFAPEEGFEFQFITGEEGKTMYKHICRIISVIPHEKLVYSWRYEGYRGIPKSDLKYLQKRIIPGLNLRMLDWNPFLKPILILPRKILKQAGHKS